MPELSSPFDHLRLRGKPRFWFRFIWWMTLLVLHAVTWTFVLQSPGFGDEEFAILTIACAVVLPWFASLLMGFFLIHLLRPIITRISIEELKATPLTPEMLAEWLRERAIRLVMEWVFVYMGIYTVIGWFFVLYDFGFDMGLVALLVRYTMWTVVLGTLVACMTGLLARAVYHTFIYHISKGRPLNQGYLQSVLQTSIRYFISLALLLLGTLICLAFGLYPLVVIVVWICIIEMLHKRASKEIPHWWDRALEGGHGDAR